MVDGVILAEGNLLIVAVHAGAGHKKELRAAVGNGGIEQVNGAVDINGGVGRGPLDARSHPGQGRQVNNGRGPMRREGIEDILSMANVHLEKLELSLFQRSGEIVALGVRIIEVAEIVKTNNILAVLQQTFGEVGPDKSGGAGDKDF